jgi:hypothetical protein
MTDSAEMTIAKMLVSKVEQAMTDLVSYIKREEDRRDDCEKNNQQDHRDLHSRVTKGESDFKKFYTEEHLPLITEVTKIDTKMSFGFGIIVFIMSAISLALGIVTFILKVVEGG